MLVELHSPSERFRPPPLAGEYKQVTVLCGGLADALALARHLGPEAMHRHMQTVFASVQQVLQHYGGSLIEFGGEGFVVLFGVPVAQEDHAQRAVLAALALHARLAVAASDFGQAPAEALPLCLGLHTGRVVVDHLGEDPQRHRAHAALYSGHDPGVCCHMLAAPSLWLLGYPDRAVASSQAALALAQQLVHPVSLIHALYWAAVLHHLRREAPQTRTHAETAITIATDQGFPQQLAQAMPLRGWALVESGQGKEGITQLHQGLAAYQAAGATANRPYYLSLIAKVSAKMGQFTEGLEALAEALATVAKSRVRWWEAELYRLRGDLLLQQAVAPPEEVESCFQQALAVARRQQVKSLELRAAMSLSRLWQRQDKRVEARDLLAPIYGWFTEDFDTADLQKAKALLDALA